MTLASMTGPYQQEVDRITDAILEIATWLANNPNCHSDIRKRKMRTWKSLENEVQALLDQWSETREAYLDSRARARERGE